MKREYNCSSWGFFNKQNWGGHLVSGLQMITGFQMGPLNKATSLQIHFHFDPLLRGTFVKISLQVIYILNMCLINCEMMNHDI